VTVFHSLSEVPSPARECAVTIGNFDGVHLGHRRLFERVAQIARERGLTPSVLTFHPHPARIVAPQRAPHLLSTPEQRLSWMASAGIEQVFLIPFDEPFSRLTAEEFIAQVLVGRLNARAVLVGSNFRFGNRQAGDAALLEALGPKYGFAVEIVSGISLRGRMVSSTEVRRLVTTGSVSQACRLLGRPYALEGEVVTGFGIGSKQTVPTLNLSTDAEVLPARGVYVTCTHDLDHRRSWQSITNVGVRPTFSGESLTIETYLLEPLTTPSPTRIRVEFRRRVREERKFDSPEALKQQILSDVARANAYFRRLAKWACDKIGA
jgi:riboflavin kinase/FMN adenylyltransferase